MMRQMLSANSPYTFVWHENGGQTRPDNNRLITSSVSIDGFTIEIAADAVIEEPIIILNSAAANNKSKNVVKIGKNAQVQIIQYLMSDDSDANNAVATNILCGENSQLQHCILQEAAPNSTITQQSITAIQQNASSKLNSNVFSFGGGINMIELAVALQGENAESNVASLAFTNDTETQNVILKVDHEKPYCTSKTIVRGILKDKSTTDLIGRIYVHPGAKKTMADLQIRNLLCSPKAQAINRPELEIYNDDVKCSHGSSTGQIDAEALFYMRSRGIGLHEAMQILIKGFVEPAIESCKIGLVRDYVRHLIAER